MKENIYRILDIMNTLELLLSTLDDYARRIIELQAEIMRLKAGSPFPNPPQRGGSSPSKGEHG